MRSSSPPPSHPLVLSRLTRLRLLPAAAVVALALLAPGSASAFCVYNESGTSVSAKVPDGDFSANVSTGDYTCCHWSNGGCNPSKSQNTLLTVQFETSTFTCALPMTAGGYAFIYQEDRSRLGLPPDHFCVSYNADDTLRADSRRGASTGSRDVRFLVTADPQYDNGDPEEKAVADQVLGTMRDLMNSDTRLRGVAIAGDLTQNSRPLDEFSWYKSAISGWSRFVFDGVGNHDLSRPTDLQKAACFLGEKSCVDPDAIRGDIANRKRATAVTNKSGPHYSWDWQDVHFVQLNLFPGNETAPQYPHLSPENSLAFLQSDLAQYVGDSGRPVVLIHHYGLDGFSLGVGGYKEVWWTDAQLAAYWDVIAPYNVVALFTGHIHPSDGSATDPWLHSFIRPAGRNNGPASITNFVSGAAKNGVFVDVALGQDVLQVIQRNRSGALITSALPVPFRTNLALGKAVSQSSVANGGVPSRAVDGRLDGTWANGSVTHTLEEFQPWWQVDLGSVQQVGTVVLHNRTDCCGERLSNFRVLVSEDGASWQAYPYPGTAPQQALFQIGRAARYVKVQLNGTQALSLAEVQVFAPVNLALGKPVTQSSVALNGAPERAVDGNTDGSWWNGSVTHTLEEYQPWWQVDLGSVQSVGTVVLHNRTDCCGDRLSNFKLMVSVDGLTWSEYPYPGMAGRETRFSVGQFARYVKVQLNGANALNLAEVQVFASPNLASGKSASQSSVVFGAEASRAVDGNTDGNFWNGSVTHTGVELEPWWQVDLGSVQRLKGITLYNRSDCCSERLSNFNVMLSDDGTTWQVYAYPNVASSEATFLVNRTARYVKVLRNGTVELSLAEVVVF